MRSIYSYKETAKVLFQPPLDDSKLKQFCVCKNLSLICVIASLFFSASLHSGPQETAEENWREKSIFGSGLDPQALNYLKTVNGEQWTQFKNIVNSLMTVDMDEFHRAKIIVALQKHDPETWGQFATTANSLMTADMNCAYRVQVIRALGNIPSKEWSRFVCILSLLINHDMDGENRTWMIDALGKLAPKKLFHKNFVNTVKTLIIESMTGDDRAQVIEALGDVDAKKWPQFVSSVISLTTEDMDGDDRAQVIKDFLYIAPEKWSEFATTVNSLTTKNTDGENRARVNRALREVASEKWPQFSATVALLTTPGTPESTRTSVIEALRYVDADKIDLVYGLIKRLMQSTHKKIKLVRDDAATELIRKLEDADTDELAQTFINDLIQRIDSNQGDVFDDRLLTHIDLAWIEVGEPKQDELRELLSASQSTHKMEVQKSVQTSVEKLKCRYPRALQDSGFNIFETMFTLFKSVFPADISTQLEDAKTTAIKLLGAEAINTLLEISPHARAGENDEDTELNIAARALCADQSLEAQMAIQSLVRLHAHKDDLMTAQELLSYIQGLPNYREIYTNLSYVQLLCLITEANQDVSSGLEGRTISEQDIKGRWLSLMTRMTRARNEYRDGGAACLAGIFNALLEPLSQVHSDVLIISSFRLMMQEISLENDDKEFEDRIKVALSYLGVNAANYKDYRADIEAFSQARVESIKYQTEDLIENPHQESGYARQSAEVDRLQERRRKSNGKRLKGRAAKRNSTQQRIAQLKLDEMRRDLPKRVEREVARQEFRITYLKGIPNRISQELEVR